MIQLKSLLNVIDNSGARIVECVNVLGGGTVGSLGSEIVVVVKRAKPIPLDTRTAKGAVTSSSLNLASKLKKGDVGKAVIVRTKKEVRRPDGTWIRFDDNACVMLNAKKEPLGTRVLGVVASEIRQKKWAKIASMTPRLI